MTNGFDKYLEYQYRQTGDFYTLLFRTIMQADTKNTARLAKGFPSEVEAYLTWSRVGVKEFVKRISPNHWLLSRFKEEYSLEEINVTT